MAGSGGVRTNDYLVQVNGQNVFNLCHDQVKRLVKESGECMTLVVERYTENNVPSPFVIMLKWIEF